MKREIPQRTLYCLECDTCGVQSPRMYSMEDAINRAKRDGWLIEEHWIGPTYVQRHYCPLDWPRQKSQVEVEAEARPLTPERERQLILNLEVNNA